MKLKDLIQKNGLEAVVEPYFNSSKEFYEKIEINVLDFDYDSNSNKLTALIVPQKWSQANESIVHGGMVATYLDTVSGVHAVIHSLQNGKQVLTKQMSIQYFAPMVPGKGYVVVSEQVDNLFKCSISLEDELIATAEMIFVIK